MIITLAGLSGAGKSTLKDELAEVLQLKKYSMGDLRGKMALDRGMTIDELNTLGMTEAFTDKDVDAFQSELGKKDDNFVIDGWLSWHFVPHSIKIFLTVDSQIAASRIFEDRKTHDSRSDEPDYASVEEAKKILADRLANNRERYQKWYGVDFLDQSHYDLVLDTTNLTREQVLEQALDFIRNLNKN